jgi:hypothetical protein
VLALEEGEELGVCRLFEVDEIGADGLQFGGDVA